MKSKEEKTIDWKNIVIIAIIILIIVGVFAKIIKVRLYDKQINSALTNETFNEEELKQIKNSENKNNEIIVEYDNTKKKYAPTTFNAE